MFKKLLLLTALFAGLGINNATATNDEEIITETTVVNENGSTTTTTITTQRSKNRSDVLQWLMHFGSAYLVHRAVDTVSSPVIDHCWPYSLWMSQREIDATRLMRVICFAVQTYVACQITDEIHQKMSDEAYPLAHFLGAVFA